MTYYQCRCGHTQWYSSGFDPPECAWCEKCDSGPATHTDNHPAERTPHKFQAQNVETDAGPAQLSRCVYCYKTIKQIEEDNR